MTDLAKAIEYEANWYAFCASVVGNISINQALTKMRVSERKKAKAKPEKFKLDEKWYLEQKAKGLTNENIGRLMGCSGRTVSYKARALGYGKRRAK